MFVNAYTFLFFFLAFLSFSCDYTLGYHPCVHVYCRKSYDSFSNSDVNISQVMCQTVVDSVSTSFYSNNVLTRRNTWLYNAQNACVVDDTYKPHDFFFFFIAFCILFRRANAFDCFLIPYLCVFTTTTAREILYIYIVIIIILLLYTAEPGGIICTGTTHADA